MNKVLIGILGVSWKTSLLGYGQLFLTAVWTGIQASNGTPITDEGWIRLLGSAVIAVALRMAKDHDVTNAPRPIPPMTVPAAVITPPPK
jgi:hypothetical protein